MSRLVKGDDSRLIMDHALPFIREAARQNTPFLAVIWFHTPHLPVVSAPPYTDAYTENTDYYGCITAMDEQMGRLRKSLKDLGIEKNTMLWFCSDNGPEGNKHAPGRTNGLRGRKRSLYEGGVRVPGLLVWPQAVQEPRTVTMPCSTSDYFPTVLAALGYELPQSKARPDDGINLLPLLDGRMKKRPKPIGFESQRQVSLTDNRYKIYSRDRGENYELYDLINDPGEKHNIADQEPEVLTRMRRTSADWRESCAASLAGKDY